MWTSQYDGDRAADRGEQHDRAGALRKSAEEQDGKDDDGYPDQEGASSHPQPHPPAAGPVPVPHHGSLSQVSGAPGGGPHVTFHPMLPEQEPQKGPEQSLVQAG